MFHLRAAVGLERHDLSDLLMKLAPFASFVCVYFSRKPCMSKPL